MIKCLFVSLCDLCGFVLGDSRIGPHSEFRGSELLTYWKKAWSACAFAVTPPIFTLLGGCETIGQ